MSQNKKQEKYNIWTMPAQEWQRGLKGIRVSENDLKKLSDKSSKSPGERLSNALGFGTSASNTPTFGKLKKA